MSRRPALVALLVGVLPVLAGCMSSERAPFLSAGCGSGGDDYNPTLVLMAQSVPSAELIPCVELVPTGWYQGAVSMTDQGSSFVLGSDRNGPSALTVELRPTCDVTGAVRVPSEHADTLRYERIEGLDGGGYRGLRYYVYDGGCTTFRFQLTGARQAQPVTEASLAVGFTTRDAVREAFVRSSGGEVSARTLGGDR